MILGGSLGLGVSGIAEDCERSEKPSSTPVREVRCFPIPRPVTLAVRVRGSEGLTKHVSAMATYKCCLCGHLEPKTRNPKREPEDLIWEASIHNANNLDV